MRSISEEIGQPKPKTESAEDIFVDRLAQIILDQMEVEPRAGSTPIREIRDRKRN